MTIADCNYKKLILCILYFSLLIDAQHIYKCINKYTIDAFMEEEKIMCLIFAIFSNTYFNAKNVAENST